MRAVEQLFKLLAPANCLHCGEEGDLLCVWCRADALLSTDSRCYRCNSLSKNYATCPACRRHVALKHVWVRTEFTDTARQLVHAMKFSYSGEAADIIAAELAEALPLMPPGTLITHVPTANVRVRQRGFDHAGRIAKALARQTGLQYVPTLTRITSTRQVGSGRTERIKQMQSAFRVRSPELLEGASVLLIDDVVTTGATLEAAARTLKGAGVKTIDAVVFAQAK